MSWPSYIILTNHLLFFCRHKRKQTNKNTNKAKCQHSSVTTVCLFNTWGTAHYITTTKISHICLLLKTFPRFDVNVQKRIPLTESSQKIKRTLKEHVCRHLMNTDCHFQLYIIIRKSNNSAGTVDDKRPKQKQILRPKCFQSPPPTHIPHDSNSPHISSPWKSSSITNPLRPSSLTVHSTNRLQTNCFLHQNHSQNQTWPSSDTVAKIHTAAVEEKARGLEPMLSVDTGNKDVMTHVESFVWEILKWLQIKKITIDIPDL